MEDKDYDYALEIVTQLADEKHLNLSEKQMDDIIFDAMCNGPEKPTVEAIMEAFDRFCKTLKNESKERKGSRIEEAHASAVYDIYNALSDVAFKWHQKGVDLEKADFKTGLDSFMSKFFA